MGDNRKTRSYAAVPAVERIRHYPTPPMGQGKTVPEPRPIDDTLAPALGDLPEDAGILRWIGPEEAQQLRGQGVEVVELGTPETPQLGPRTTWGGRG